MSDTKVIFRVAERDKAELKLRLKYDNLDQTKFFKACIQAYLTRDELFINWLNEMLEKTGRVPKTQRKVKEKNDKQTKIVDGQFKLSEGKVKEIFDMLEKENPKL